MIEMGGSLLDSFHFFSFAGIFLICAATAAVVSAAAASVFKIFRIFVVIGAGIQAAAWRQLFVANIGRCRRRIRVGAVTAMILVDSRRLR